MNDEHRSAPEPADPALAEAESEELESLDGAGTLLELVLAEHAAQAAQEPRPATPIHGVLIGRLCGIGPNGEPLVDHPGRAAAPGAEGTPARAMTPFGPTDVGREVALLFEGGDPTRPVVMGLMHTASAAAAPQPDVEGDGERLVFTAEKEIVLRCGDASITLTRAGKVIIRGAYLLARSSGVNRIQGGSVQIN